MKKSIRKMLAFMLSVLMLISAIPMASMAEGMSYEEGDFIYEINGEEATIIGYKGTATDIVIPDLMGGAYTVVAIGYKSDDTPVFYNNTNITSVILPDSVTEVVPSAFYGCTNLKDVDLGDGVTVIGNSAFQNSGLETIIIGEKLTAIASLGLVSGNLKNIYFKGTEKQWAQIDKSGIIDSGSLKISYNYNWVCEDNGCKVEYVEAKEPTCYEKGNIAYNLCPVCLTKTTPDGEGIDGDVTLAESHSWVEANCTTPRTCSLCGKTDGDIPNHKDEDDNGYCDVEDCGVLLCNHEGQELITKNVEYATCEEPGYTGDKYCEKCDTKVVDGTVIEPLDHDRIFHEAKAPTCTVGGWDAYETCSRCAYSTRVDLPENGHIEVRGQDVPATCTKNGFNDTVVCETCGITVSEGEMVPKLGHNMVKNEVRSFDSTCKINGELYMVCSREGCDYEDDVIILDLVGCTYTHFYVTESPTCNETGLEASVCDVCGIPKAFVIPKLGHSYDLEVADTNNDGTHTVYCTACDENTVGHLSVVSCIYDEAVTAPTCTQAGYTTYTCAVCEYSYQGAETDANGHDYGEWESNDNGTHTRECTVCSDEEDRTQTENCTFGEWTETVAPKCEENGEKERVCSECEYVETADVDMLGHKDENNDHNCDNEGCDVPQGTHADEDSDHACDYGCDVEIGECEDTDSDHECDHGCGATFGECSDSANDDDHTCDYGCGEVLEECADGDDKNHSCDICGEENITEHIWVEADCVTPETCSHCEETRAPKLGHDEIHHDAQKVTCTEIGWDAYVTCSRCDYTTYEEIPALTHNIIDVEAQAPTCTEIGWEAYEYCDRCDYSTYEEIEANGHDEVVVPGTDATCTEDGITDGLYCEVCDTVTLEQETIEALGHDFEIDEANSKKVTCTEDGIIAEKCSRCDAKEVTTVEATGHSITSWVTSEEPTCTKEGSSIGRCTLCRYYTETKKIDKIPCADENGNKKCDMCEKAIQDSTTEKPDENKPDDTTDPCACYCHTKGIIRFFLFDIPLLFQRFFGLNKTCKCGATHY